MKKGKICLLVIFIVCIFHGLSIAKIYKWVDEQGIVHFTDYAPEEGIESTTMKMQPIQESAYSEEQNEPENNDGDTQESRERQSDSQDRYKNTRVELYVTDSCTWCKKAKEYLRFRGIDFGRMKFLLTLVYHWLLLMANLLRDFQK